MSLAERLQELIETHESRIKGYEGRIEKLEKDINKNRGSFEEYHTFIELEKEQISVIKKKILVGWCCLSGDICPYRTWWIDPKLKSSHSKKKPPNRLPLRAVFYPVPPKIP